MSLAIRKAQPDDASLILRFIRDLADYEKLAHEVVANEETLRASLFGTNPKTFALIAEWEGKPAGFAIYFYNFSTFLGRNGIYVEDIYVDRAMRGHGIGTALFEYLAAQAEAEGCGRLEWWVLDWNEPAINFYKRMEAQPMDEWTVYRLQGRTLNALAAKHKKKVA